jgi:PAS domain S-box-containing protein
MYKRGEIAKFKTYLTHDIRGILRTYEEKYRELFEQSSDGIFILNSDHKYIDVNRNGCMQSGYPKEEIIGQSFFNLADVDNKDELREMISKVEKGENTISEWRVKRKNGDYIWLEANTKKLSDGNIQAITKDITTKKKVELDLFESEEKYKKFLEFLPNGVYVRIGREIVFANAIAVKIFGVDSVEEVIGKTFDDLVYPHPDSEAVCALALEEIEKTGILAATKLKIIRMVDDSSIDIQLAARTIIYDGKKANIGVVRDLTDEVKNCELRMEVERRTQLLNATLEYDKLKTDFFANLSHELRTPLNVILGVVQLQECIYRDNANIPVIEKSEKYIRILKQNCYRLLRLVNNILDITKIDAGYFVLNLRNENIIGIVEDITLSVVEYAEIKGIELIFDTDIEEKIIAIDSDKIERIMMNLLSNALKFTPENGKIIVRMYDCDDKIGISVKDSGIGIPLDKQKSVFERFIQVDKSLSRQNGGSGIGLSLVKSLVEMHNGTISLVSEEGKGSEFIIELPCKVIEFAESSINNYLNQSKVERVNIEFSDIYK